MRSPQRPAAPRGEGPGLSTHPGGCHHHHGTGPEDGTPFRSSCYWQKVQQMETARGKFMLETRRQVPQKAKSLEEIVLLQEGHTPAGGNAKSEGSSSLALNLIL